MPFRGRGKRESEFGYEGKHLRVKDRSGKMDSIEKLVEPGPSRGRQLSAWK